MDSDEERERSLKLAERVLALRAAAKSPAAAHDYVIRQLAEAEQAFAAGFTTRHADAPNGQPTPPSVDRSKRGWMTTSVAAMFTSDAVVTSRQVRDALGLDTTQAKKCFARLIKAGTIERRGPGKFRRLERAAASVTKRRRRRS